MYYEVAVVFTEEIQTKSGIREKKVTKNYLVECYAVTAAEAKISEYLSKSQFAWEVKAVKQSKILDVIGE
tara:strand:- start:2213 stop:2422 length:210 start_codon:yes stop_codon:yes gene_type:complete